MRETYQVSPISLCIETMGLHPSNAKISLISSSPASEGISLRIIVLRPPAFMFDLILLSSVNVTRVDEAKALRTTSSSCVKAFNFANYATIK